MTSRLLEPSAYSATVVAVPPLALTADGSVAQDKNAFLLDYMSKGGVQIVLYGGNANLYHYGSALFEQAIETMVIAREKSLDVIGSIGPDYGKACEQASLVAKAGINNVMLLPMAFPTDSDGIATAVRRIADILGNGVIFYIKRADYIAPDTLSRLVEEGAVRMIKYAVEFDDPANDPYLDALIRSVGVDVMASGMGETPVVDHVSKRKLATFTSGAICLAPRSCLDLLPKLKKGQLDNNSEMLLPFLNFERVRKTFGGIQVLHEAVSLGLADMGPPQPMLSSLTEAGRLAATKALKDLMDLESAVPAH